MSTAAQRTHLNRYLDAVAAELNRRGITIDAVTQMHPSYRVLSGTLIHLHPLGAPRRAIGWGPMAVTWDEEVGWSVELLDRTRDGSVVRFLPHELIPAPGDVATFVVDLASNRDLGSGTPTTFRYRDADADLLAPLARFADPHPGLTGRVTSRTRW